MGYWQKESEFGKKVGCFKASLGLLGLMLFFSKKNSRKNSLKTKYCQLLFVYFIRPYRYDFKRDSLARRIQLSMNYFQNF